MDRENSTGKGDNNSYPVGNAGLILFHPFLPTYFSRNGLLEDGVFKSEASRRRAVLLLQYLAAGNTTFAGEELVLNQLLCGMQPGESLPASFSITENEIAVSRELLQVVISRWDKLKNSSVESLQQTFIMREGVLAFKGDGTNLTVEQKGYDVLLQTLPWAWGTVKTAWMGHTLTVDWI